MRRVKERMRLSGFLEDRGHVGKSGGKLRLEKV
jgi:hypothetical protein